MPRGILTILLLVCSNAFMTLAWYGHIVFKSKLERVSLAAIVLLSWGVALFEYCFQVPANRIGSVEYGVISSAISASKAAATYSTALIPRRTSTTSSKSIRVSAVHRLWHRKQPAIRLPK